VVAVAGGAVLIGAIIIGIWWFARREVARGLSNETAELHQVTELKALQLAEWYRERTDDALGRSADPFFVGSVRQWMAGSRSAELEDLIRTALAPRQEPWRYQNVWLIDRRGDTIFDARRRNERPAIENGMLDRCFQARAPVFGVLRGLSTAAPFVDLCMPLIDLRDPAPPPQAAAIYRVDANQLLLPTVRFLTKADASAVTTVFELRSNVPAIVLSSAALAEPGEPSVVVPPGFVSSSTQVRDANDVVGRDGRRRLVVARPVNGTPWMVATGVTRESALVDVYENTWLVAALIFAVGVATYVSLTLLWVSRERSAARRALHFDRLLRVRSAINEAIARIRSRDEMLSRFCEIAVSLGRFNMAVIYEWIPHRSTVRIAASAGEVPDRLRVGAEIDVGDEVRTGTVGKFLDQGQVAVVPDLHAEPPSVWRERLLKSGHRAIVAMPLREHGAITGGFWLYSREPGVFHRDDERLFEGLAGDIRYALEAIEADKQRRFAEAQLRAVFSGSPFAMFLIDRADHARIVRVNGAAAAQYGYREDELIGQPATVVFSTEQLQPSLPLGDGVAVLPVIASHVRKDGKPLKVEVTSTPVAIDGKTYDLIVAVNVTERRQLEEQYRQSQRLEAVGKLAGGIAHDFNNLLTVISGFASFLLEDLPEDAPTRRAADQIRIAANRAAELTRGMLAFSRRQVLKTERLHLNDVVRETATMLSRLIPEDIAVNLTLDARQDYVNVDPAQMQQVIMNLAVNARDAMPHGGRVTIATRDLDGHVELTVSDTGHGMDADTLEHIFEPFFTTKPAGEGTGLGLPTVHGIVTQSGGTITVDSTPGRGTTFVIQLPRVEGREHAAADGRAPAVSRGSGTVMVVEDDPGVRELAKIVLSRGGFQVIECTNGATALDRAASSDLRIDLLVTDVVMPGMSGPELVSRLRAYYPRLPVLYMSGYAEEAARRLGIEVKSLDLLHKPFAPPELLARVKAALTRA